MQATVSKLPTDKICHTDKPVKGLYNAVVICTGPHAENAHA